MRIKNKKNRSGYAEMQPQNKQEAAHPGADTPENKQKRGVKIPENKSQDKK